MLIFPSPGSAGGVFARRSDDGATWRPLPENRQRLSGRGRETGFGGAAPAGGARNPALGRPWVTVRPHYGGLPLMAGRGADEGWRKPAGSGRAEPPVLTRKIRSQGQKSPRWSAEWRAPVATGARAARRGPQGCAARRSIPSACAGGKARPRQGGEGRRRTRRLQRTRAMALGRLTNKGMSAAAALHSPTRGEGKKAQSH